MPTRLLRTLAAPFKVAAALRRLYRRAASQRVSGLLSQSGNCSQLYRRENTNTNKNTNTNTTTSTLPAEATCSCTLSVCWLLVLSVIACLSDYKTLQVFPSVCVKQNHKSTSSRICTSSSCFSSPSSSISGDNLRHCLPIAILFFFFVFRRVFFAALFSVAYFAAAAREPLLSASVAPLQLCSN